MLSPEDNEMLCRVGPGTAGGALLRRYWTPALLSEEVPEPDGAPVEVRLFGEDLVAFRDSAGRVGLLEEACPHRRTSLALALNDDCGLRCIYHGYKFDVNGTCVDTPTEPAGSVFHTRIRAQAYPTREAQGVIWAYLGPEEEMPVFPEYPWLGMPDDHSVPYKILEECNWAQAVEQAVDSAHAGVLHRYQPWGETNDDSSLVEITRDLAPKLEIEPTQYGFRYAALRNIDSDRTQVRITAMALPFWTVIPPTKTAAPGAPAPNRRLANAFVPRDDYTTWHFQYFFDDTEPIDTDYRRDEGGIWLDENYRKLRNRSNWWLQDREMMKKGPFSGIEGILTQDHAVSEAQGPLMDRSREHLGRSDRAIVAWRRLVLLSIRALATSGEPPRGVAADIPYREITSVTEYILPSDSWQSAVPLSPALLVDSAPDR